MIPLCSVSEVKIIGFGIGFWVLGFVSVSCLKSFTELVLRSACCCVSTGGLLKLSGRS